MIKHRRETKRSKVKDDRTQAQEMSQLHFEPRLSLWPRPCGPSFYLLLVAIRTKTGHRPVATLSPNQQQAARTALKRAALSGK